MGCQIEELAMNHSMKRSLRSLGLALAGTIALASLTPALAAPVMSSTAMLRQSAPAQVIDVRWRGRHRGYWGGAAAAGLAAGLLAGAAVAGPRYYYDDGPYYYGPPPPVYYEAPPVYVAPAPVYRGPVDPNGAARKCWVATYRDRGYGYWRPC
jgi:hypothetical protein